MARRPERIGSALVERPDQVLNAVLPRCSISIATQRANSVRSAANQVAADGCSSTTSAIASRSSSGGAFGCECSAGRSGRSGRAIRRAVAITSAAAPCGTGSAGGPGRLSGDTSSKDAMSWRALADESSGDIGASLPTVPWRDFRPAAGLTLSTCRPIDLSWHPVRSATQE